MAASVRELLQNALDFTDSARGGVRWCVWKCDIEDHRDCKSAVDRVCIGFEQDGALHAALTITTHGAKSGKEARVVIAQFGHPLSKDTILTGTVG